MRSGAGTVEEYLSELPPDRRTAIAAIRSAILRALPEGYEEGMQYGMIGYYIPLERHPDTYNGEPLGVVALASQKRHMSLYLHGIYADEKEASWFRERWAATGRKLDMGRSCVRFRRLEDVPLEVVAEAAARITPNQYIGLYERSRR